MSRTERDSLDPDVVRRHSGRPLPVPGTGRTRERLDALRRVGRLDLCLAKVVEPHHDAAAICSDLGYPQPEPDSLWAVWAAQPPRSGPEAVGAGDRGPRLHGDKPFCSGAALSTHALVTARSRGPDQPAWSLYVVDLAAGRAAGTVRASPASWVGRGMAAADTRTVSFDGAVATLVGGGEGYTGRPGFWHGAVGIAACWLGGAQAVGARLLLDSRRRTLDSHALAHLGAVAAVLDGCLASLDAAAAAIDGAVGADSALSRRLAESVRATVANGAEEVVSRVGRALGPAPLSFDEEHAHRVADLQVFVRQHHAERDLAVLGELVTESGEQW